MNNSGTGLLLLLLGGTLAFFATRRPGDNFIADAVNTITGAIVLPSSEYDATFSSVQQQYGIPDQILKKIAWRESRFRPDIVSGATTGAAGEIGIMQLIPEYHPLVDYYNPTASITYAGSWLTNLYAQFGNWVYAVMAYNWGPANVTNWLNSGGFAQNIPASVKTYITEIFGKPVSELVPQ